MKSDFFALLARMKYIERWSLMRNITRENIAEHSFFVALLSHALACIRRDVLGLPCDPERAAALALFHDASEIFTGDLPTPIKHFNPEMRAAYAKIEEHAAARLLRTLPGALAPSYAALLAMPEDYQPLVRAADKLAAYIKCIEERTSGNTEFSQAEQSTRAALEALAMPEVTYFLAHFIPSFDLTLDELER